MTFVAAFLVFIDPTARAERRVKAERLSALRAKEKAVEAADARIARNVQWLKEAVARDPKAADIGALFEAVANAYGCRQRLVRWDGRGDVPVDLSALNEAYGRIEARRVLSTIRRGAI